MSSTTTTTTISLTLDKTLAKHSIFRNVKCEEYVDVALVKSFVINKLGISYKTSTSKRYNYIKDIFDNEQQQLEKYIQRYNDKKNTFSTTYWLNKDSLGRVNATDSCSLSIFHRPTRHALAKGKYIDIDMRCAHQAIFTQICLNSKDPIKCDNLTMYASAPKEYRQSIMDYYNVSKDCAKNLPIILCYGGSYDDWCYNWDIDTSIPKLQFFKELELELSNIMTEIFHRNPQIQKDLSKRDPEKYKDTNKLKKGVMSQYATTIERILQENAIKWLIKNKKIPIETIVSCQDGFMILLKYYYDGILGDLLQANIDTFGLCIHWDIKEFDEAIEIPALSSAEHIDSKIVMNNDSDATDYLYSILEKDLVYSNSILFMKHKNVYIYDEKRIKAILKDYVFHSEIYKRNEKNQLIDYVQNTKCANNIVTNLIDKAIANCDNNWMTLSAKTNRGYILFNNGYCNLKTGLFYPTGHPDYDNSIVFFEKLTYDFGDFNIEYINDIKQRLFYDQYGNEIGDYFILNIARGMACDDLKRVLFGIGPGNTGKSMLSRAILNTLEGYGGTFNACNIAYNEKKNDDEAKQLRWLMLLWTKRIICSSEIKMGVPIDGGMLKKMSNGGLDDIVARGHQGNETPYPVNLLPIVFANDLDNIKPMDDGVVNRVFGFSSEKIYIDGEPTNCYELKKNDNLVIEIGTLEFKKAFMGMLILSYADFRDNKFKENICPDMQQKINKMKKNILGSNISVIDKFLQDYEITGNDKDFIPSSEIENWIANNKLLISMSKFGYEIKKYAQLKDMVVFSKDKKIASKTKQAWFGVRYAIDDDIQDE